MAGFSKLYVFGGQGGFMGADGVNPIGFMILVGDSGRQWLEPHYIDKAIKPLGKLGVIIPQRPDHLDSLLDACIAFAPWFFESCPSMATVTQALANTERLDFDAELARIPAAWAALREEARPLFAELNCWQADLKRFPLA